MVTIKEIAKISGFSSSTVSRVLNNDNSLSVTQETRNKIIHTALSLGYNRAYIKTPIEKVAFLYWITDITELEDIYFKDIRIHIENFINEENLELVTIKKEEGIDCIPKDISGFIAVGGFSTDELSKLKKITTKGVFIDSNPDPDFYDSVMPNTPRITQKTIDYFIKNGHENIGFIGGTYHNPDTDNEEMDIREISFRDYTTKRQVFKNENIFIENEFTVASGYKAAQKAIELLKDDFPTAILVASDAIAVGVLQALNETNISIPTRTSIVSINNIEIAKYLSPPLSTFHIDVCEICRSTIQLLSEQIFEERSNTKSVLLNSKLIVRKSFIPSE